ncbi:MAG TPA: universal stress protein [Candidatus Limnocylindrales bacterium]|nr:universal stress protein [Candidatus Limnocylindrales bacterium]
MRVLLALDGSAAADHARVLTGSLDWPAGSVIEVVAVARSTLALTALDPSAPALEEQRARLDRVVADAARALSGGPLSVETRVLSGRPASIIVDEAARFRADLVIVGSRGHGPIPTMLLGSTSAEVVDRAPCPVLVARSEQIGSVVLGVDGSETAQLAIDYLAGFGLLKALPSTVVSVVPPMPPLVDPMSGIGFGMYAEPPERAGAAFSEARAAHERIAMNAAHDLRAAGFDPACEVRDGDPAHVLIELARQRPDALLVVGTHGRTGITRVVLGSVARNVLLHAGASVLVVRGPVRERQPTRMAQAAAVGLSS